MSSSDSDSGNTVTPLRPSRKRRPEKWEKNVKKVKRNSGQSYVGVTKKLVPERKIGPPCDCKNKCYDKVGRDNIKLLFDKYWAMENHDLQSQYIHKRVTESDAKRSRVKDRESRSKKNQRVHSVRE